MTTDELELERDLKRLAQPRPDEERLRLTIRAALREDLVRRPRARRRNRVALGAAPAVATAELPNGVIGYFDQTDYRPVYLDNPQGDGTVVRTQVLAYEELPLNSENERLLSVTAQHPDAKVETDASPTK